MRRAVAPSAFQQFCASQGDLNARREAIVRKAFSIMDKDGSGELSLADLAGIYNAKKHPDVVAGKSTEAKVLSDFLQTFEGVAGNRDGVITIEEFKDYYADIGAGVPNDDFFVEMMESCWMVTESGPSSELEAKIAAWAGAT